jgi:outer membrane beta-barrel protein
MAAAWVIVVVGLVAGFVTPARAEGPPPAASAAAVAPGAEGPPPAASAATVAPGPEGAGRGIVPASDESVYVVQPRAYSKSGRLEVTSAFYTSLSNRFVGYLGPGISVAWHVRENFAIELNSSIPGVIRRYYSDLVYETLALKLEPIAVDLKQMTWFAALSLQFSTLYGKLDLYGHLVDYDFYVAGGAGAATTVEICEPAGQNGCSDPRGGLLYGERTPSSQADAVKLLGSLAGGMRVFFTENLGLRFELRDLVFADRTVHNQAVTTDIRNNVFLYLGATLLL